MEQCHRPTMCKHGTCTLIFSSPSGVTYSARGELFVWYHEILASNNCSVTLRWPQFSHIWSKTRSLGQTMNKKANMAHSENLNPLKSSFMKYAKTLTTIECKPIVFDHTTRIWTSLAYIKHVLCKFYRDYWEYGN